MRTYMPEGRFFALLDFTAEINSIGGYDKYIYMHLAKHAYRNDFCFVSQQKLAAISSSSLRTVQRCLSKLDKTGLVRVVKEGTFKKYYLTIPQELEALAEKYGLICSAPNKESGSVPQACAPAESCSFVNMPEIHDKFSRKGDNLSHINKRDLDNNNHSPLPPHASRPERNSSNKRSGGVGSFIPADLSEIQKEFQELQEHYPRNEDMREAFEVFVREHGSLPPIGELVSAIEYEKTHNGKWQREAGRYVPYLKNWLKFRQFESALQFIKAEAERAARAALAAPVIPPAMPDERQPEQEAIGEAQPFIKEDFEACVRLWKLNPGIAAAFKAYWTTILQLGVLPSVEAARSGKARFNSAAEWLRSFKEEQYAKIKMPVSSTNSSCRSSSYIQASI